VLRMQVLADEVWGVESFCGGFLGRGELCCWLDGGLRNLGEAEA